MWESEILTAFRLIYLVKIDSGVVAFARYVEKMISSEEREGESEERNFISFNYSLNVHIKYFPLHIKCSHETQYSLRSSDHLFAGNSREKMGNL